MEFLAAGLVALLVFLLGVAIGIGASGRPWLGKAGLTLIGVALLASPYVLMFGSAAFSNPMVLAVLPVAFIVTHFLLGFAIAAGAGSIKHEFARSTVLVGGGALFGLLLGYIFFSVALYTPSIGISVERQVAPVGEDSLESRFKTSSPTYRTPSSGSP